VTRIGILAVSDVVTTARYFERAAAERGLEVVALTSVDPAQTQDLAWLLAVDPFFAPPGALRHAACPTLACVIDVHQQLAPRLAYARYFDYVFAAQHDYVADFSALPHPSAHWLALGCDREVHFVPGLPRTIDVGFVGKLGHPGSDRHTTLSTVLAAFATNDWGRSYAPREMGEIYSRSKIVFNKSINGDLNMRFFEGLAAGALLVTDRIGNGLDRMGQDGVHFVTYSTIKEAIETIRYYLAHEDERAAIALAGHRHVFAHHTYAHRLDEMLAVVAAHPQARAPARSVSEARDAVWRSEHMRLGGAPVAEGLAMLAEGYLSLPLLANVAVGVARGIVRPLRQRLQRPARGKP
jgi:hypothetical protein